MRPFLVLACICFTWAPLRAQDWDRYKPGSLLDIITAHDSSIHADGGPGKPHWALSGEDLPTKARLVFTGDHRSLSPERRSILEKWQKSFGVDSAVLRAFTSEYRFKEDTTDLWVAVQVPLEAALAKEAIPGKPLTALTTFIGGFYEGGPVTWLFLLNEFDTSD